MMSDHSRSRIRTIIVFCRNGSGSGGSAPRGQSLLRSQARCALLPAPSPWVRAEPPSYGVDPPPRDQLTTLTAAVLRLLVCRPRPNREAAPYSEQLKKRGVAAG